MIKAPNIIPLSRRGVRREADGVVKSHIHHDPPKLFFLPALYRTKIPSPRDSDAEGPQGSPTGWGPIARSVTPASPNFWGGRIALKMRNTMDETEGKVHFVVWVKKSIFMG